MPRRKQQAPRRAAGTRAASLPCFPCLPFPPRPLPSPLASLRVFRERLPRAPLPAAAPLPRALPGSSRAAGTAPGLRGFGAILLIYFLWGGGRMKARSPLLVPTLIYCELCHGPARFRGSPVRGAGGCVRAHCSGSYGRCHSGAGGSKEADFGYFQLVLWHLLCFSPS